jgi:rabenosyn-5
LADSCPSINENDTPSQIRYAALCRNIRMYAIYLLQNHAISTRRVPTEEDVEHAREESTRLSHELYESERAAKAELASRVTATSNSVGTPKSPVSGWRPTVDRNLLERAQELEPLVQQIYQVTQFIRQAQIAGRDDEVKLLQSNLKELEQAMNHVQQPEKIAATADSQ